MIKTILVAGAIALVLFAMHNGAEGRISLETCSLSCSENEHQVQESLRARAALQGPPGKRGPVGLKGEPGVKGDRGFEGAVGAKGDSGVKGESGIEGDRGMKGDAGVRGQSGPQGIPGPACDCSHYEELARQLQQQLNDLRDRVHLAPEGWTRASNNRYYKYFSHEMVNYETAKSRCAAFNARLAAAGLRTAVVRSEIKRLLPNPILQTWIGLDDLVSQGNYVWEDGVVSTRSNTDWLSGEPNLSDQRCAVIGESYFNGQVLDETCTGNHNYICEF